MSENKFRVGGCYRDHSGDIIRLTAARDYGRVADGEILLGLRWEYYPACFNLESGVWAMGGAHPHMNLIPGELTLKDGAWVPVDAKPSIPMNVWIPWKGGECPVPRGARGLCIVRGGAQSRSAETLSDRRWNHIGMSGDIVAYMVTQLPGEKPSIGDWTAAIDSAEGRAPIDKATLDWIFHGSQKLTATVADPNAAMIARDGPQREKPAAKPAVVAAPRKTTPGLTLSPERYTSHQVNPAFGSAYLG